MSVFTSFGSSPVVIDPSTANKIFIYPGAEIFRQAVALGFAENYPVLLSFGVDPNGTGLLFGTIRRKPPTTNNVNFIVNYELSTGNILSAEISPRDPLASINLQDTNKFDVNVAISTEDARRIIYNFQILPNSVVTSILDFPNQFPRRELLLGSQNPLALPLVEITQLQLLEEVVCQLNYKVITEKGLCCSANCDLQSVDQSFVQYCINITPFLIGKGCSLTAKIAKLQAEGKTIDYVTLIRYVIIRLIFSSLLCMHPFNKFDPTLLQRRYYTDFIKELKASQFSVATDFFTDPNFGLQNYWRYFIA